MVLGLLKVSRMKHSEFEIGKTFWCGKKEWRCTDIGTRTVAAICLDGGEVAEYTLGPPETRRIRNVSRDEREMQGWFNGPPYATVERVLDENDFGGCSATQEKD
jgi:hypothetical protein